MKFAKFEFTPIEWATLQKDIQQTNDDTTSWKDCAVVEIGFICLETNEEGECTKQSDKWAVDILFYSEPPASFAPFEVFPSPVGIHTFAGCDDLYLQSFCAKFPESEYCVIPSVVTDINNN